MLKINKTKGLLTKRESEDNYRLRSFDTFVGKGVFMRRIQILGAVLLLGGIVFIQGCVAVAAAGLGVGTVAYIKGDLQAVEAANLDEVYRATEKALDELEFSVTKRSKDALSAVIVARDAADKKITIKLSAAQEDATKISIRVGTFGNETKSRMIYDQIKKYL